MNQPIELRSSDPTVVSVEADGSFTGHKAGTVVLTAIGVSDWELTVTVQYPGPWWRRWWLTLRQWVRDRRDR